RGVLGLVHAGGDLECSLGVPLHSKDHGVVPDGSGAGHAINLAHRRVVVVADPNAHRVAGRAWPAIHRVAQRPVVLEVLARAGLVGGRPGSITSRPSEPVGDWVILPIVT